MNCLPSRLEDTRELLASISTLGPQARVWANAQPICGLSLTNLSRLGQSALDGIHRAEVVPVTGLIFKTVQRLAPHSSAALLAAAGIRLSQHPAEFSMVRNLYRTFQEMLRVPANQPAAQVLARLGNRLLARDGRTLLAFMAEQPCLNDSIRQLALAASEVDGPHPKLIFQSFLGRLPETISGNCSTELRHDLLVVRLMTQERPQPSLWQRLLWAFHGAVAA